MVSSWTEEGPNAENNLWGSTITLVAGALETVAVATAAAELEGPAEVGNAEFASLNTLEQNLLVCEPCLFLDPKTLPQ